MRGHVGPSLAYLILRVIPTLSHSKFQMSHLAWDVVSPEFEDFVLYVKACPLPGKCLGLKQSLVRPGAHPTCHLEVQGLINEYVTAFLLSINSLTSARLRAVN